MRIVIALGGNALLRRGQPMTAANQRENVQIATRKIAEVARDHQVVIVHGNGPQVGLLSLQADAYTDVPPYPLDVLGAETQAQIGYMVEQELGNCLGPDAPLATLITMVEVDGNDPAFTSPTKPIGPVYDKDEAERLAEENDWTIAPDGEKWRRVVPSPVPQKIVEMPAIDALLEAGITVTCTGGGDIPVVRAEDGTLEGIEAVIDKDLASAVLADAISADLLVIATDVDGVYVDWGTEKQRRLGESTPEELEAHDFAAGSMGPKVRAASQFARSSAKASVIGSLEDISRIVAGEAGTRVVGAN